MLQNYMKIAWRNFYKNKIYSFINIAGFAIGLATCILIVLFVIYEWNHDRVFEHSDRIYRIVQTTSSNTKMEEQASTPFPLAPVISEEFPHIVEKTVRFFDRQESTHTLWNREKSISFRESNLYFVDSTFIDVFNVELLQGNPRFALANELSLVLSESAARKYFGDENAIGKVLSYAGIRDLTVTGIMKDWPSQSHIQIDAAVSFTTLNQIYGQSPDFDESWLWNPVWTYVLMKDGASARVLESHFDNITQKYYYAYSGWPAGEHIELELQPLTDIYLHSSRDHEMNANGSVFYLYLFSVIAIFILAIACINFTNLATARSLERAKEVGLRKVMGGNRNQIFAQFISESFFACFAAVILGVVLVKLLLPWFNELTSSHISFSLFQHAYVIPGLLLLTLAVSLLSGSYPAMFLSSYDPVQVLKSGALKNGHNGFFRKALITFQFALSIFLIIGTTVTFLQLRHMQNKDLGFDKNNIILLPTNQNLISWEFDNFIEKVSRNAYVESITGIGKIPGTSSQEYYRYVAENEDNEDGTKLVLHVTHDFTQTFDIPLLAGRTFSRDFATDPNQALLINKKMLPVVGADTPDEALGTVFYHYTSSGERQPFTVVGVLDDFNYTSLKKEIEPLAIRLLDGVYPVLAYVEHTAIEVAPGNTAAVLGFIEEVWKELNPIDPFEYSFLDQELEKEYEAEAIMSSLSTLFSILSIALACMGLLGLASYAAQQKKQEIGIRKSLGASVSSIVTLLSSEFMLLVLIANIIAWPGAYYLANSWLLGFPYRIDLLSAFPFIFGGTGLAVLLIALCTISYHSIKAGLTNPMDTIRGE